VASLLVAITLEDMTVFETLIQFSEARKVLATVWKRMLANIEDVPDDTRFLEVFREHRNPSEDYLLHYVRALTSGKFRLARWLYDTGVCDLSSPIQDGKTLLACLLVQSKTYLNTERQLENLMELGNLPDTLFYNIAEFRNSKFTAIHLAVYFPEYQSSSSMAPRVLRQILSRWHEPQQLNAQISEGGFKGKTPMHIAALTANDAAIRRLLEVGKDDLDLDITDCDGFNVLDTAVWGLASQEERIKRWKVSEARRHAAGLAHLEGIVMMIARLLKVGAKPHKISMAVMRMEEDSIRLFKLDNAPHVIKIQFSKLIL
jgi:hypothetical protein